MKRIFFYLICSILVSAVFTVGTAKKTAVSNEIARTQEQSRKAQEEAMKKFLARQTDGHKLVSLMKRLPEDADARIFEMIAKRAHELIPTNQEIAQLYEGSQRE